MCVSTHSRPKAAGRPCLPLPACTDCFNTQPPEGGWQTRARAGAGSSGFNTQPPEGGWFDKANRLFRDVVSTHSRPKAAGRRAIRRPIRIKFQHTAARRRLAANKQAAAAREKVSTHSRPKAAGGHDDKTANHTEVSTHSRPKAAG